MTAAEDAAAEHYTTSQKIVAASTAVALREWSKIEPFSLTESFSEKVWPQLLATLVLGQRSIADEAEDYLKAVTGITEAAGVIDPGAFAGFAADGRALTTLLQVPMLATKRYIRTHPAESAAAALAVGAGVLGTIIASEVRDAGRTADQVALVEREEVSGYVRKLQLPSCPRCAVLAGREYRWSDGFLRHPHCDCIHVPYVDRVPRTITTDPELAVRSGKVHGLSKADREAIQDGADVSQVINAHRGMYTAAGRKYTSEGTSRQGYARMYTGNAARVRPETIYAEAGSRREAISMLRENGYIV